MEGDCYTLASKYLEGRGVSYIITDDVRGRHCKWNFVGNTDYDFKRWCELSGLRCGGNPFVVAFDSVYAYGRFMAKAEADYLREQERAVKEMADQRRKDSLSAVVPPLPMRRVNVEYLELGQSTAERLGFDFSEYVGSAHFLDYTDLFSVSIQARNLGDSSFVYRTYTSTYDSSLTVFWGGKRDRLTQSNVTSTGIVSNNYETETYGLTFTISGMKYSYEHSSDYEHSINGSGRLVEGSNFITGAYQYEYEKTSSLPFLGAIPLVRYLFSHSTRETETRFIFISVYISDVLEDL